MRQPDRDFILAGQSEHTADMVTMLVRHDDAVEIARLATNTQQTGHGLPQPEAAIEHQGGLTGLDEQRVTGAAAAERGKTDHCNC